MSLVEYQRKRKFDWTPEPKGKEEGNKGRKRFVVQKHAASHLHYDFRLEMEGVLKSWAVPKGPPAIPGIKHLAVWVEDHPLEYINFKGIIPKGQYGAGKVEIWDHGFYDLLNDGLSRGKLQIRLHGRKLKGVYELIQFSEEKKNWLFIKKKENNVITAAKPEKKGQSPMPHEIKPMLAKLTDQVFDDPDWIYEMKWDGYRAIAEVEKGKAHLYSRHNLNFDDLYPQIVESLKEMKHDLVIDGEIVAIDSSGKPRFQLLQEYRKKPSTTLIYYVFDLLYLDGQDLRDLPIIERKELLKKILEETDSLRFSDHIVKEGAKLFNLAKRKGFEGIMAKKKDSRYVSLRTINWLKIKSIQEQEAVIGGFTKPKGTRWGFGALVLGVYDQGKLRYIGHTGGGFDDKELHFLMKKLKPLETEDSPFDPVPKTNMPVTWVKPILVCQVKFREWTGGMIMRQPIFGGLREDKKAKEVVFEIPVRLKK